MNLRALFETVCPSGTRKRYVSPTGNDSTGTGSEGSPYATIGRATYDAVAGDQILVAAGTYGYTRLENRHGTPWQWITLLPATPEDEVVITIAGANTGTYEELGIIGSSFVGVYGIDVHGAGLLGVNDANVDRSGISIYGGSHHIRVWGNHVHDLPGGGINCFEANGGSHDMLDLSFNRIHGTSRFSPSNTSGISIYGSRDTTGGVLWKSGHGYRLIGNHIWDVLCTVPFTPGGFDFVTDGNGVSLDLILDTNGYTKPILAQGNLIHGCGARAIHAYGTVNVDMLHNVGWGNLRTDSPAINGDPEFDSEAAAAQTVEQAQSVVIHGNIIVPTKNGNWADNRSTYTSNVVLFGAQAVSGTNLDRKTVGLGYAVALAGDPTTAVDPVLFTPGTPDLVPRHVRASRWGTLALRSRPVDTFAVGAFD